MKAWNSRPGYVRLSVTVAAVLTACLFAVAMAYFQEKQESGRLRAQVAALSAAYYSPPGPNDATVSVAGYQQEDSGPYEREIDDALRAEGIVRPAVCFIGACSVTVEIADAQRAREAVWRGYERHGFKMAFLSGPGRVENQVLRDQVSSLTAKAARLQSAQVDLFRDMTYYHDELQKKREQLKRAEAHTSKGKE